MEEWLRSGAAVATPLIAIAALITSIWVSQRVKRKREFEILLEENRREAAKREAETRALTERIDREAAKREAAINHEAAKREAAINREAAKREERFESEVAKREEAIQALFDRSDRNFEALLARSDELVRQSAGVVERVVRNETRVETLEAARPPRAADPSAPAAGETEAVAAQDVPVERHPE